MGFKLNRIKADLKAYPPYLIMGESKVGKSTLFRDLVLYNYKTPTKGLLLSIADENGYYALDQLQVEDAKVWDAELDEETGERGFVQILDDLIINKNEYGIEMVCIDTLDKLVEIATEEVLEMHRKLKGKYPVSLNAALGGYNAGPRKVAELMVAEISRLSDAGYAVFILSHVKKKENSDAVTGTVYEEVTNNLMSTFFEPVSNICQMVVNIVNEKDFSDTIYNKEIKDKSGNVVDDYDVKRVLSSRRMMYFLNNGVIRAGGRFDGLPEKLELSAENFMKAFEAGVKGSKIDDVMTDEEFEKTKSEDNEELSKNYDKLIKNEMAEKEKVKEDDLKSEIFNKFNNYAANNKITKPMLLEIQKINKEHGIKNYNDIPSIPMDVAKKIEAILNTIEE